MESAKTQVVGVAWKGVSVPSVVCAVQGRPETGFEVNQVRDSAYPLRGVGLRTYLRRMAVTAVRRVTYQLITVAIMSGRRLVLTPAVLNVLRKPDG